MKTQSYKLPIVGNVCCWYPNTPASVEGTNDSFLVNRGLMSSSSDFVSPSTDTHDNAEAGASTVAVAASAAAAGAHSECDDLTADEYSRPMARLLEHVGPVLDEHLLAALHPLVVAYAAYHPVFIFHATASTDSPESDARTPTRWLGQAASPTVAESFIFKLDANGMVPLDADVVWLASEDAIYQLRQTETRQSFFLLRYPLSLGRRIIRPSSDSVRTEGVTTFRKRPADNDLPVEARGWREVLFRRGGVTTIPRLMVISGELCVVYIRADEWKVVLRRVATGEWTYCIDPPQPHRSSQPMANEWFVPVLNCALAKIDSADHLRTSLCDNKGVAFVDELGMGVDFDAELKDGTRLRVTTLDTTHFRIVATQGEDSSVVRSLLFPAAIHCATIHHVWFEPFDKCMYVRVRSLMIEDKILTVLYALPIAAMSYSRSTQELHARQSTLLSCAVAPDAFAAQTETPDAAQTETPEEDLVPLLSQPQVVALPAQGPTVGVVTCIVHAALSTPALYQRPTAAHSHVTCGSNRSLSVSTS